MKGFKRLSGPPSHWQDFGYEAEMWAPTLSFPPLFLSLAVYLKVKKQTFEIKFKGERIEEINKKVISLPFFFIILRWSSLIWLATGPQALPCPTQRDPSTDAVNLAKTKGQIKCGSLNCNAMFLTYDNKLLQIKISSLDQKFLTHESNDIFNWDGS